jgi:hypothetical protein
VGGLRVSAGNCRNPPLPRCVKAPPKRPVTPGTIPFWPLTQPYPPGTSPPTGGEGLGWGATSPPQGMAATRPLLCGTAPQTTRHAKDDPFRPLTQPVPPRTSPPPSLSQQGTAAPSPSALWDRPPNDPSRQGRSLSTLDATRPTSHLPSPSWGGDGGGGPPCLSSERPRPAPSALWDRPPNDPSREGRSRSTLDATRPAWHLPSPAWGGDGGPPCLSSERPRPLPPRYGTPPKRPVTPSTIPFDP